MKPTVLVIGSNSFSGSDFIDLLLETGRYSVIGISRSPEKSHVFLSYKRRVSSDFHFFQMDLNHDFRKIKNLLGEFKPQYIVNFAAQSEVAPSWSHPQHWFQTNAVAMALLGNYLKDQKWLQKYVHISSPEIYGTCSGVVTENYPMNPSTPYAASKAAGDLFFLTLVKNFQFPLVMIRSTNVYGAGQQLFKIIPRSVIRLKSGRKIQLHGGGRAVKSYIHIRDVSRGELAAMEKGTAGAIYHLSPDKGHEVREVVASVCRAAEFSFDAATETVAERLGQDAAYVIDSSKARKAFGWQPEISLESGIQEVVLWIEKNWEVIQKLPEEYVHQA